MRLAARDTEAPQPYVVPPSQQFDGNDGSWSTFVVSVGTPGQDFRVLPSTKGSVTYLIAPEGCLRGIDPAGCPESRGAEVFNSAQNIGFQTNVSSTWSAIGQYDVNLEEALNYTSAGLFGFDRVQLGTASISTSLNLDHQVVAGIADPDYYMGVLPLGTTDSSFSSLSQSVDSLMSQLRNASKIPSLSYAYTAGAPYRLKSVFGSLILGGYDSTRFTTNNNNNNNFSFTFSTDPSKLLTVGVDSIMATNTLQGTFSLTSGAHFSVIDSTVPHLWLPEDVCNQFEAAFGLTYDPQTDLYLVNDTIHQQLRTNNPTITLKLVNSLTGSSTNYTNIELPYGAFDLQASYPYYQNATNYFPIRRAANSTQYVLGRTLLQESYLIVDYERANFSLAQAAWPDPLPASNIITINPPPSQGSSASSSSSTLSTGAIIGIAIGASFLILLALLAVFLYRRRRRRINNLQNTKQYELAGAQISQSTVAPSTATNTPNPYSSSTNNNINTNNAMTTPLKAPSPPQELSGTPLTELASPTSSSFTTPPMTTTTLGTLDAHGFPQDRKAFTSVNDEPAELHAESRTPVTPRWQEVTLENLPLPLPAVVGSPPPRYPGLAQGFERQGEGEGEGEGEGDGSMSVSAVHSFDNRDGSTTSTTNTGVARGLGHGYNNAGRDITTTHHQEDLRSAIFGDWAGVKMTAAAALGFKGKWSG
ncbi:acid protease [Plenodomus tracheiphilus IPT5]|uniref:Acid protease n=1 Tax=Plenodomus tracheiphilus IPT5 TaxID=1408161 RepID=A0A6A7B640_9PLEO|nr:acid protease [Plenodomus tracheiphilus IPT5]